MYLMSVSFAAARFKLCFVLRLGTALNTSTPTLTPNIDFGLRRSQHQDIGPISDHG